MVDIDIDQFFVSLTMEVSVRDFYALYLCFLCPFTYFFWRVKLTVAFILGAPAGAIFAPAWSLCRTLCPYSAKL